MKILLHNKYFNNKMGIYEVIFDCGDGYHCVNMGFTGCSIRDGMHYYCKKHADKIKIGETLKYDFNNFSRLHKIRSFFANATLLEAKKVGKHTCVKFKLQNNISQLKELKESSKIYYSEFDNCPSWHIENDEIYIIDFFLLKNIDFGLVTNTNENIIFGWYCGMCIDLTNENETKILKFNNDTMCSEDYKFTQEYNNIYDEIIKHDNKKLYPSYKISII